MSTIYVIDDVRKLLEEYLAWLEANDIRYTPRVKFPGKSGYDHHFDFVIPKSRKSPERILQAVNRAGKESAQSIAFSWIDTREVRDPAARAYALINDEDREISSSVTEALKNYDVTPVLWSKREQVKAELAA